MDRRSNASIDIEVSAVKAQLELLQRQEEVFEKVLQDIKTVQQSLSAEKKTLILLEAERHPIHWLPSELLSQIFSIAVGLMKGDDEGWQDDATVFHHPSVLSNPSLWSCLTYHGTRWLEDLHPFIRRSGDTPLDIIYRCRPDTDTINEER
jgi:hypothetical protein